MIKKIEQFLKEMNKIIDSYFPYWLITQIPVDFFIFDFFRISGIYILYSEKKIIYIGCSNNIGSRLRIHLGNKSSYKYDITDIEIIRFRDNEDSLGVEAELISKFKPRYNKAYPYGYPIPKNFNLTEIIERLEKKLNI